MVIQTMVPGDEACREPGLYYRVSGQVEQTADAICLSAGTLLSTDSYMNLFDAGTWHSYTGYRRWGLCVKVRGAGLLRLTAEDADGGERLLGERTFACGEPEELQVPFEEDAAKISFSLQAETNLWLYGARYQCRDDRSGGETERQRHIRVCICTYHRREELQKTLNLFRSSRFFCEQDELYGKLSICVADNASELAPVEEPLLRICHNPNTGGSGGFGRCMREARRDMRRCGITHVVFMDDDAEILLESFYRLYAFLMLQKEEYRDVVVLGRMFRTDLRYVQYTAAEVWNRGDLLHVGSGLDMRKKSSLRHINDCLTEDGRTAEYGGWWFAAYPMRFVEKNDPEPYFLHCDDVEYGLRHRAVCSQTGARVPVILNGIQVWHETAERRQNPVLSYYDMRNTLFVNWKYGLETEEALFARGLRGIRGAHAERDYLTERLRILAVWDFCRGMRWLECQDSGRLHRALGKKRHASAAGNAGRLLAAAVRFRFFWMPQQKRKDKEKHAKAFEHHFSCNR